MKHTHVERRPMSKTISEQIDDAYAALEALLRQAPGGPVRERLNALDRLEESRGWLLKMRVDWAASERKTWGG